jgi:hypothetical protein
MGLFSPLIVWSIGRSFPFHPGWPLNLHGHLWESPLIADLDRDDRDEIIVTVNYPWRVYVYRENGTIYNSSWLKVFTDDQGSGAAAADLDGDGDLEIVAGDSTLYAWHHTGEPVAGFPVSLPLGTYLNTTPVVGDVTGDMIPEIIVGVSNFRLYMWDARGRISPGFPKEYDGVPKPNVLTIPALGDLDHDSINDMIVATNTGHIYAYKGDGGFVNGYWDYYISQGTGLYSEVTLADIDNDGRLEILFVCDAATGDFSFFPMILRDDMTLMPGWPPLELQGYTYGGLVAADLDGDGSVEIVAGSQTPDSYGIVYVWDDRGILKNGWPITLEQNDEFMGNMILGDVDGQGAIDIIGFDITTMSIGKVYAWDYQGTALSGFPIPFSGFVPFGTTGFIADLDHDGKVEIGVGGDGFNGSSRIAVWDLPGRFHKDKMPWPQSRHDDNQSNNAEWWDVRHQVPALGMTALVGLLAGLSISLRRRFRIRHHGMTRNKHNYG